MKYKIEYFALLREQRGLSEETLESEATTPSELYHHLKEEHDFSLEKKSLKVAVNEDFADWDAEIKDGDVIVFIPPVAGG